MLATLPTKESEHFMQSQDYLGSVKAIRLRLNAADDGLMRPAEEIIIEWEAL